MTENTEDVHAHESHALPEPTVWPMAMAAGITLAAAGIPTNVWVFVGGVLIFLVSIGGWVRDLILAWSDQDPKDIHHGQPNPSEMGGEKGG